MALARQLADRLTGTEILFLSGFRMFYIPCLVTLLRRVGGGGCAKAYKMSGEYAKYRVCILAAHSLFSLAHCRAWYDWVTQST